MKIAVDGPAGAGKSTVSKIVAQKLNLLYIDTGAMYRAITYALIKNNVDLHNEEKIKDFIKKIDFSLKRNSETGEMDIFINGEKVNEQLRKKIIDLNVSLVSSYKSVREFLVKLQRKLGQEYDVILDGRDIGTVVFPDADVKFYIDASVDVRAKRRLEDKKNKEARSIEEIKKQIIKRDKLDSTRKISPLKKADDAIYIDTSNMSIDEVVNLMIQRIQSGNTE